MSSVVKNIDSTQDVRRRVSAAEWEARVQLAACYRLVAHYGWTDLIYTHFSARVPAGQAYVANVTAFGHRVLSQLIADGAALDADGRLTLVAPEKWSGEAAADQVATYSAKWHSTLRNDQRRESIESLRRTLAAAPPAAGRRRTPGSCPRG